MTTAVPGRVSRVAAAVTGPGVGPSRALTIRVRGDDWVWLDGPGGPVHVTRIGAPRGPLTALVVQALPAGDVGDRVSLSVSGARRWAPAPAAPMPEAASLRRALEVATPQAWPDPDARRLRDAPLAEVAPRLVGRGPGLTPAGDDVLLGYLRARHLLDEPGARADARLVMDLARRATGEPSRSLLAWAGRGIVPEPVERALSGLLDPAHDSTAIAELMSWGATSGSAALAGLVAGLWSAAAPG